jgi:hypothetical protein
MKKKCIMVFLVGMFVATASYSFFQQWMNVPKQMIQMPMQMMKPQCECKE